MEKLKGINILSLGRHSLLCLASWCEVSVGKPCIISAGIFGLSSAEVSLLSAGKASRSQGEGLFFFSCPSAFLSFSSASMGTSVVFRTALH